MADKEITVKAAPTGVAAAVEQKGIKKIPTPFKHVFLVDINDNGQLREVALVKEEANGSLIYIDIASLDIIDKGRLKKFVSSMHADKYPLWELMSLDRLSNGVNGLDYFHQMCRTKYAPGHVNTAMGGGLSSVRSEGNSAMPGANFSDPNSGTISG
jgi:hypothetical protein